MTFAAGEIKNKKSEYKNFLADKTKPVPAGENFCIRSFLACFLQKR